MLHNKCFTVNPFQENSYLIYNESGQAVIVDPGFYNRQEENLLVEFLTSHNLELTGCLLTHAHLDHIFGCRFVFEKYGLKPQMHRDAKAVYESAISTASMYGVQMQEPPVAEYVFAEDGTMDLLGVEIEVYHTPGHSPGSVSFYSPEDRILWSGDVLFQGSIGRTDLPGGSFDVLENSIRKKLYQLPDDTVVKSGHGADTNIGWEKMNNPFVRM